MRIALLVLLLLAGSAAGQGVYITNENLAAPNTGDTRYAMSPEAPTANPSFKDYIATGFGALTYTTAFEYSVEQDFTAGGELTWRAYVSCDRPTAFRPGVPNDTNDVPTYRAELVRGTSIVATDVKYEERTCDGPSDIWEAVFTFDVAGESWAAGDLLRVNNVIWVATGPAATDAKNVHVLGGEAHLSGLTGPGLPGGADPGPVVVHENITRGFRHTFETPHDNRYILSFPVDSDMNVTFAAQVTEGSALVVLRDAAGAEIYNATWNATGGFQEAYTGQPGNWTFDVQYEGFVGVLEGNATPLPPPVHGGGNGTGGPTGTGGPGGNGTEDGGGEASPLPVWFVAAALGLAALRRRHA